MNLPAEIAGSSRNLSKTYGQGATAVSALRSLDLDVHEAALLADDIAHAQQQKPLLQLAQWHHHHHHHHGFFPGFGITIAPPVVSREAGRADRLRIA